MKLWLIWLSCLLSLSLKSWGLDLWLKPQAQINNGFIRLSDLILDSSKKDTYKNVFLGKTPMESQKIPLSYIQQQLRKRGFLTVRPMVKNQESYVRVSLRQTPHLPISLNKTHSPNQEKPKKHANKYLYCTLKADCRRGTLLSPDLFELTPEARLIEDAFCNLNDVVGYRLERTLSKGSILTHRHVTIPMTIERGAVIKIIMRSPGIEITGVARSIGEGVVGDTIAVRRTNSRETLKGQIIDAHTVLIQ